MTASVELINQANPVPFDVWWSGDVHTLDRGLLSAIAYPVVPAAPIAPSGRGVAKDTATDGRHRASGRSAGVLELLSDGIARTSAQVAAALDWEAPQVNSLCQKLYRRSGLIQAAWGPFPPRHGKVRKGVTRWYWR